MDNDNRYYARESRTSDSRSAHRTSHRTNAPRSSQRNGFASERNQSDLRSSRTSANRNETRAYRASSSRTRHASQQQTQRGTAQEIRGAQHRQNHRANTSGRSKERQIYATHHAPKARRSKLPFAIGAGVLAVLIVGLLVTVGPFKTTQQQTDTKTTNTTTSTNEKRVSFLAMGDNLPDDDIGYYADASSGTSGDNSYDYGVVYNNIKQYVQAADLSVITEETPCAGDAIGPRDYEVFNANSQLATAVADTGFDVVALATNHLFDWTVDGGTNTAKVFEETGVTVLGSHSSSNVETVSIVEKNGIKFAFLNYNYGVNGRSSDEFKWWQMRLFSEYNIQEDIAIAKRENADVIIAITHWGTEKDTNPNEFELTWAQYLADAGVNMIVGSHTHCIQPLTWLTSSSGNSVLCAYGLGNMLSNFQNPDTFTQLGGALQCDFVKKSDGSIAIENVVWNGIINHNEANNFSTYYLTDYSNELAAKQPYLCGLSDTMTWAKQFFADTVNALGNNFVIKGVSSEETTSDSSRTIVSAS